MNEPWRFIWLSDAAIVYAVNVLIAASVACAAGLVADVALRRRSLPLRHGVLQAALVAAVASLGLVHVAQRQGTGWIALDLPAAIGPRPWESLPAGDPAPLPAVNAAAADVTERVVPRAIGPRSPLAWMRGACALAAAVWLAGAVWGGLRLARGLACVARFRRTFTAVNDDALLGAVAAAAAAVGLRKPPPVVLSRAAPTPLVAGLWRPVIVLPHDLRELVGGERLQPLLVHESAHIAHGDQWTGLWQRLIETLFWPVPLVHAVGRRAAAVREDICDNHAIEACGTGVGLAEVLVQMAERVTGLAPLPATIGLFDATQDGLASRVERLLDDRRNTMTRTTLTALLAAAAFAAALGGGTLAANFRLADAEDKNTQPGAAKLTVYVQVVNGLGQEDKTDEKTAAAWIIEEVKRLGSSRASAHTSWIELSDREREIYASGMGGRLIKGKATANADGQLEVEINGFKIGKTPRTVSLKQEIGAKSVIKLTQYPGERNVYLALHVGNVD